MKTIRHDKLVRDNIPDIVTASGQIPVTDTIPREMMAEALDRKLSEEVGEFIEDHSVEEMADILEVLHGIAFDMGVPWEEVEKKRLTKREARGGFEKRVRLIEVREE